MSFQREARNRNAKKKQHKTMRWILNFVFTIIRLPNCKGKHSEQRRPHRKETRQGCQDESSLRIASISKARSASLAVSILLQRKMFRVDFE